MSEKTLHPLLKDKAASKPKPHRKLIFLSGYKNTGKDTVAELIKEISPDPVVIVSFADAVKSEVYPKLGKEFTKETDDRAWRDKHRSEIIQYGEGQKHNFGQNYWIKKTLDDLLLTEYPRRSDYPHIIVTDARRVEELLWYKHFKLGHYIELAPALEIYKPMMYIVHRDGADKDDSDFLTHVALEYATETRMFNKLIKNYEGTKELRQKIKNLYVNSIK